MLAWTPAAVARPSMMTITATATVNGTGLSPGDKVSQSR